MEKIKEELENKYSFDILIYDLGDNNTQFDILTRQIFYASTEKAAMRKAAEWIEKEYAHFENLEWVISKEGGLHININGKPFCDV